MEVNFVRGPRNGGKILAFADVVVGEGIIVRGFRVVDGANGVFAAVPSRSFTVDGKLRFVDQVSFVTAELRDNFLSELLEKYYQWRDSPSADGSEPEPNRPGLAIGEESEAPF